MITNRFTNYHFSYREAWELNYSFVEMKMISHHIYSENLTQCSKVKDGVLFRNFSADIKNFNFTQANLLRTR